MINNFIQNLSTLDLFDYIILPAILILGTIITIGDFKENKIKNKWIKFGIYLGLIYYGVLLIITILNSLNLINTGYLYFNYFGFVFLNTLIAFILGFTLWYFKLWAGGDAKLFALYVFLIPLSFYEHAYFKYWPALTLLINILLPIFVYLLIKMLLYPFQLWLNYIKNPKLIKEYYQKYQEDHKIDKSKLKEYLNTALSFIVILIAFQLLRTKVDNFLSPYLGNLVTISYFFMGFVIFKPLRTLLKPRVILVLTLVLIYFIFGWLYFPEQVLGDLHKLFALQIIIMMSYFYIFKYGRDLGRFLYNSAEVKMVPVEALDAGVFINKRYIEDIMGDRSNFDQFRQDMEKTLEEEEQKDLMNLIGKKDDKENKDKNFKQVITLFRGIRPQHLPRFASQIYEFKRQRNIKKILLNNISEKLNKNQKKQLNNMLKNTNDVKEFLKSIKGRLTREQAQELKKMIQDRNKEISQQGHPPVEHIILHKTFSFAPFMLLGVIITILTKSSIIHLIYQYILHR